MKSLLIKTKDNRKFLTSEDNLIALTEFAKIFKAEIYHVEAATGQKLMKLSKLTSAICSSEYPGDPDCLKLEKIFPSPKRQRHKTVANAEKIRAFIAKNLLSGKTISLKQLKIKYKNYKLTDACLCNHLSATRRALTEQGHQFQKLKRGVYCLQKQNQKN